MTDRITVLMSTFNGAKYLRQQIESILHQQGVDVQLVVRDDGSTDGTVKILHSYQQAGKIQYYSGPNLRTARSFLNLLAHSPKSSYYAFSDQDDVWQPTKLARAVSKLRQSHCPSKIPLLYAGSFQMTDSELNVIQGGGSHYTTTTFANAIVYSCCTGCTMVMNRSLRDLVNSGGTPHHLLMHDDWIHKVCLAVGGQVIFDPVPMMYYRQHGNNVDGGIHTLRDKIQKVLRDHQSQERIMSHQLADLLAIYGEQMPSQNRHLLQHALTASHGNIWTRMRLAFDRRYAISENRNLNHEFRLSLLINDW